jgi:hypothetical protein
MKCAYTYRDQRTREMGILYYRTKNYKRKDKYSNDCVFYRESK